MQLKVNTTESIKLIQKLNTLHRSGMPSAIRNTLNDLAFESKKLIPKNADEKFTVRSKNMFKKYSGVNKASGFNIKTMKSKVGLDGSKPNSSKLIEGLSKQEKGGTVDGRKLLPHDKGRVSGSFKKKLQTRNQFGKINIATPKNRKPGSKYILIKKGSKGTVFNVKGKKLTPVLIYRSNSKSRVKKKPYVFTSALEASKKRNALFIKNAEFQIRKLTRV